MRLSQLLVLLSLVFVFANCSKDETPAPDTDSKEEPKPEEPKPEEPVVPGVTRYFTLNEAVAFSESDYWLIIHNQDGELLDYRTFKYGDSLIFEALDSELEGTDKLSITFVQYTLAGVNHLHSIRTYTGIDKGVVWNQGSSESSFSFKSRQERTTYPSKFYQQPSQKSSANFNITVNNVPNIARYNLTSRQYGNTAGSQVFQNTSTLNINEVTLQMDVEYLLSIEDGQGNLRYQLLAPQETVNDIVLEYTDFLEYDHILQIALPEHSQLTANVWAYETDVFSGTPLLLSSQRSAGPADPVAKLGYINDFGSFETTFSINTVDHYSYNYEELGKIPDEIIIMEKPAFEIQESSKNNFQFSININFLRSSSFWSFKETMSDNVTIQTLWHVEAPKTNSFKIGDLPQEIVQKCPYLNLDNLDYESTTLILRGRNYEDIINSMFNSMVVYPPIYEFIDFYNINE